MRVFIASDTRSVWATTRAFNWFDATRDPWNIGRSICIQDWPACVDGQTKGVVCWILNGRTAIKSVQPIPASRCFLECCRQTAWCRMFANHKSRCPCARCAFALCISFVIDNCKPDRRVLNPWGTCARCYWWSSQAWTIMAHLRSNAHPRFGGSALVWLSTWPTIDSACLFKSTWTMAVPYWLEDSQRDTCCNERVEQTRFPCSIHSLNWPLAYWIVPYPRVPSITSFSGWHKARQASIGLCNYHGTLVDISLNGSI